MYYFHTLKSDWIHSDWDLKFYKLATTAFCAYNYNAEHKSNFICMANAKWSYVHTLNTHITFISFNQDLNRLSKLCHITNVKFSSNVHEAMLSFTFSNTPTDSIRTIDYVDTLKRSKQSKCFDKIPNTNKYIYA